MNYIIRSQSEKELYHHGLLGMKWGIRRYQPYPKGHKGGKEIGDAAKVQKKRAKDIRNSMDEYGRIKPTNETYNQIKESIPDNTVRKVKRGVDDILSKDPGITDLVKNGHWGLGPESDEIAGEYRFNFDDEKYEELTEMYLDKAQKVVDDYLGAYGDMPVKRKHKVPFLDNTIGERVVETMLEETLDESWDYLAYTIKNGYRTGK